MFLTCLCKLELIEKDLSQYLHLYGCSPVWVLRCRVKLADLGNILPQKRQVYFCFAFELEVTTEEAWGLKYGGCLGRPPSCNGWNLRLWTENLAAILLYKSKWGYKCGKGWTKELKWWGNWGCNFLVSGLAKRLLMSKDLTWLLTWVKSKGLLACEVFACKSCRDFW